MPIPGLSPEFNQDTRSWYIFGSFDGATFQPELNDNARGEYVAAHAQPLDWGPDFYAAQTWFEGPKPKSVVDRIANVGRTLVTLLGLDRILRPAVPAPVMIGWMNNWRHVESSYSRRAERLPTAGSA